MSGSGTATGCYKCGRPGHWSRDCPFTAPTSNSIPNPNPNSTTDPPPPTSTFKPSGPRSAVEKPKKPPRTRPKLTPELLLSDDGLGYVLRYFPRNFKYHGRGHETSLRELRERVANGGDPSKLREPPVVDVDPDGEQENGEASHQDNEMFAEPETVNNIQEDLFNDIYDKATEEPSQPVQNVISVSTDPKSSTTEKTSNEVPNNGTSLSSSAEITAEQRARMKANRLKALERRAAKASIPQSS